MQNDPVTLNAQPADSIPQYQIQQPFGNCLSFYAYISHIGYFLSLTVSCQRTLHLFLFSEVRDMCINITCLFKYNQNFWTQNIMKIHM